MMGNPKADSSPLWVNLISSEIAHVQDQLEELFQVFQEERVLLEVKDLVQNSISSAFNEEYHAVVASERKRNFLSVENVPNSSVRKIQTLETQVEDVEQKLEKALQLNRSLKSLLSQEQEEREYETNRVQDLKFEIEDCRRKFAKIGEENQKLKEQLRELRETLQHYESIEADFQAALRSKNKRIEILEKTVQVQEEELQKLEFEKNQQKIPPTKVQVERNVSNEAKEFQEKQEVIEETCNGDHSQLLEALATFKEELHSREQEIEKGLAERQKITQKVQSLNDTLENIEKSVEIEETMNSSKQRNQQQPLLPNKSSKKQSSSFNYSSKDKRDRKDLGKNKKKAPGPTLDKTDSFEVDTKGRLPELDILDSIETKITSIIESSTSERLPLSENKDQPMKATTKKKSDQVSKSPIDSKPQRTKNASKSFDLKNSNSNSKQTRAKMACNGSREEKMDLQRFKPNLYASEAEDIQSLVKSTVVEERQKFFTLTNLRDYRLSKNEEELELELFSQSIVARVLDRIGFFPHFGEGKEKEEMSIQQKTASSSLLQPRPDHLKKCLSVDIAENSKKSPDIVSLRMNLEQEKFHNQDLQAALQIEREKCLEWMERHNLERDGRRLAQAELEEIANRMEALQEKTEREKEEGKQLKNLYQTERNQSKMLEEALRLERDNFEKIRETLDRERSRSKAASERDTEIIIELRTALEMEREKPPLIIGPPPHLLGPPLPHPKFMPFPSELPPIPNAQDEPGKIGAAPEGFGCIGIADGSQISPSSHAPGNEPDLNLILHDLNLELIEEKGRVDALKHCLEQEREKSEMLMSSLEVAEKKLNQQESQPIQTNKCDPNFQDDWNMFHNRKAENLELQKIQLGRELQRQKQFNSRLNDEIEHLRGQLRTNGAVAVSKSYENFYVRDLESKLDAYRAREFDLNDELQKAKLLVEGLQEENSALLQQEKEIVLQSQFDPQLLINGKPNINGVKAAHAESENNEHFSDQLSNRLLTGDGESTAQISQEMQQNKIERLIAFNEALQDKVRLLENRIQRLKDDFEGDNIPAVNKPLFLKRDNDPYFKELKSDLKLTEQKRQSLIWQKQFLLLLLNAHVAASMGSSGKTENSNFRKTSQTHFSVFYDTFPFIGRKSAITRFRIAAFVIKACGRLWKFREEKLNSSSEAKMVKFEPVQSSENEEWKKSESNEQDSATLIATTPLTTDL